MFEPLHVGQHESIIYWLDLYVHISWSTYLAVFMAHEGSRVALKFPELRHRLQHNYIIITYKPQKVNCC